MYILYHCGIKNTRVQLGCHIESDKRTAEKILIMYAPSKIIFQAGLVVSKKDIPSEAKIKKNLVTLRERLKLNKIEWR